MNQEQARACPIMHRNSNLLRLQLDFNLHQLKIPDSRNLHDSEKIAGIW